MAQVMLSLPTEIVEHMLANCPGRTDEALQSRFGISYNTWRQIERGAALRRSVAVRLIQRVADEQGAAFDLCCPTDRSPRPVSCSAGGRGGI